MATFTPGPWTYRPQEFDDWGFVRAAPEEGRNLGLIVATARAGRLVTNNEMEQHRENGTDPFEANARLIAAAPDLYEACAEFVRKVDAGEARSSRSYEQMKSALAKARGQS